MGVPFATNLTVGKLEGTSPQAGNGQKRIDTARRGGQFSPGHGRV